MKKLLGIILLLITVSYFATGDRYIPINLNTVLKLAGANNLTIKQYELEYQLGLAQLEKAREWYLPNLFIGPTFHYLKGATIQTTGDLLPDVTQKELWLGGWITGEWDFKSGIYGVLAQKQHNEALKFETVAQRNNVILQAVNDYYDLLTSQLNFTLLTNLLRQADTLAFQIKVQVDAGLRYQSEYLLAKSSYDHIVVQLTDAKVEMRQKSDALLNILNIDTNALLLSTDTAIIPVAIAKNIIDTSMSSTSQYLQNRPEFQGMVEELKSIETQKKSYTVGMLMPSLVISSPDAMLGAFSPPYYSTYHLDGAFGWDIPLGLLIYKGEIKIYNSQIQLEQNTMAQFGNTVHQQVEDAQSQIILYNGEMNISRQALKESGDALTQSIERELLGTVRPFEVFQSEQFYVQAQTDYFKTIGNYNKAQYALYVAEGNNL